MGLSIKNFEEGVDPQFICPHCHGVFIDPVLCQCSHILCWSCYKRRKKRNELCLVCCNELSVCPEPLANEWTLQLGALKVTCPKGCNTVVCFGQLSAHFNKECPFSMTLCTNKGCSRKTRRMDLENHMGKCDFRIVTCCCGIQTHSVDLRRHELAQKCVSKKNLQAVMRKRREMEQAIKDHRVIMQKKCFEVEFEQRRIEKSKHWLASPSRNLSTAMSEPVLNNGETLSLQRYQSSHSAPIVVPSQRAALKTCGQCGKLFASKQNHKRACAWHPGVSMFSLQPSSSITPTLHALPIPHHTHL